MDWLDSDDSELEYAFTEKVILPQKKKKIAKRKNQLGNCNAVLISKDCLTSLISLFIFDTINQLSGAYFPSLLHFWHCRFLFGATKGIGKGIALQLGSSGAKVYFTGRTQSLLNEVAEEIKARGGEPHPVQVDHGHDKEVEELFAKIGREQNGKLDVLVNNAYTGVNAIISNMGKKFWEMPNDHWDVINGVGLRGHFLCSMHGARLMVEKKRGLIVNISSAGGLTYLFNTAYGVGKAGCDRMAADCGHELKKHNVAMISLWPGPVKTEFIQEHVIDAKTAGAPMFEGGESIELSGQAVAHLAADANIMSKSGRILMTGDLAREYGFVDVDGETHDMRSVSKYLAGKGHTWIAAVIPGFIRVPLFVLHYMSYKF